MARKVLAAVFNFLPGLLVIMKIGKMMGSIINYLMQLSRCENTFCVVLSNFPNCSSGRVAINCRQVRSGSLVNSSPHHFISCFL